MQQQHYVVSGTYSCMQSIGSFGEGTCNQSHLGREQSKAGRDNMEYT